MRQKTKKMTKLGFLLGIIVFAMAIVFCFQNAYAGEENNNAYAGEENNWFSGDFDVPLGVLNTKDGTEVWFNSIPECNNLLNNKFRDQSYMKITFFKDCDIHHDCIKVPKGKAYDVDLGTHKLYNEYNDDDDFIKEPFFYAQGKLNLYGVDENRHATIYATRHYGLIYCEGADLDIKNVSIETKKCSNGAIHFENRKFNSTLNMENCTFNCDTIGDCKACDCKQEPYGALFFSASEGTFQKINVTNCVFENCNTDRTRGIFCIGSNASDFRASLDLKINKSKFINCCNNDFKSDNPIDITAANNSNVEFNDCLIKDCASWGSGGAISFWAYSGKSKASINRTTIENCRTKHDGGAIRIGGLAGSWDAYLNDSKISNCTSVDNGGAIDLTSNHKMCLNLDKTEIVNCSSKDDGGAIYANKKDCNINLSNNSKILNCKSNGDGGAIAATEENININLDSATIDNCSCKNQGGAIYMKAENSNISMANNSLISHCSSGSEGGAITSRKDHVGIKLDNSKIDSCHAGNDGGAMYMRSSNVTIAGTTDDKAPSFFDFKSELHNTSTISNCWTTNDGGAIFTSSATSCGNSITIKNINFLNNKSNGDGGAVATNGKSNQIAGCCFNGNRADGTGGAIDGYSTIFFSDYQETQVKNCEFYNNHAAGDGNQFRLSYVRLSNVCNNRFYYPHYTFNPKDDDDIEREFHTSHDKDPVYKTFKAIDLG